MTDPELVRRKIALIAPDLTDLGRLAAKTREDYLASRVDELVAERLLERVIGRMIDINYHLIVEAGQPPPTNYHASFTTLGSLGILPAELAHGMASCAGLRNRIVHEYDEIDPAKVHEALQPAVRDIPAYLRHVHDHLERSSSG